MKWIQFILLLGLLFIALPSFSENKDSLITKKDIEAYTQEKKFQYENTVKKQEDVNWISLILRELFETVFSESSPAAFRLIFNLILFAIVVFAIYRLITLNKISFYSTKNKTEQFFEEIDIHNVDFEKLILENEKNGNIKEALRYRFLQILKNLDDLQYIHWKPSKTNNVYIKELKQMDFVETFGKIVKQYELTIYGNFSLNRNSYEYFKELTQQIPKPKHVN